MSVEEVSLYFLGGDPIPYFGLVPIDPRSSFELNSPAGVGPVDAVVPPAAGPPDVPVVDLPPGPEVSLAVLGDQAEEVILLGAAVQADGDHVVGGAEPLRVLLGEL